jgi:pilus assembly protein FimV
MLATYIPASVSALGLGAIKLNSNLNQTLDAEIVILSLDPSDINEIKITLASHEAYKKAGVDRTFLLSRLKFNTKVNKKGKPTVYVTTKDPMREPFLNFLVEVNWPNGRMLREYTLLLDPPVALKKKAAPVIQSATTAPRVFNRQQLSSRNNVRLPRSNQSVNVASGALTGSYKVRANDSLWKIAKRSKAGGATTYQTMMALYRENKDSFGNGNINNLKRGQILRIPDAAKFREMTHSESKRAYQAQVNMFARKRNASKKVEALAESTVQRKTRKEVVEIEDDTTGQLKLATSTTTAGEGDANSSTPGSSSEAQMAQAKNEFMLIREEVQAQKSDNTELTTKNDDLIKQLEKMKRLLSLKDEQLATLQAQENVTPEQLNEQVTSTQETTTAQESEVVAVLENTEETINEDTWGDDSEEGWNEGETTSEEIKDEEVWEEDDSESGYAAIMTEVLETVSDNIVVIGGAFGGIIILFIIIKLIRRRRDSIDDDDDYDPVLVKAAQKEAEEEHQITPVVEEEEEEEEEEINLSSVGGETEENDSLYEGEELQVEISGVKEEEVEEEFDIPDFDEFSHEIEATETSQENEVEEEMDFNLDFDEVNFDEESLSAISDEDETINISSFHEPEVEPEVKTKLTQESLAGNDSDEETNFDDISFDEDNLPEEELSNEISSTTNDDFMSLENDDEVETKLDLAKAYIDMGDPEGAKEILEEVVAEGDDKQKLEAESLINGL